MTARHRMLRLGAALTVLCAGLTMASAVSIPDWAKAIAAAAPPLGEANPKEASRVLLQERRMVLGDDGELRTRVRIAKQVLSGRGDADATVGVGWFPFTDGSRMKSSKAWHLPPGDDVERASGLAQMDLTISDSFLTDQRARGVAVQNLRRGSLVFFEFESVEMPRTLTFVDEVDRDVAVATFRLSLEVPGGWTVRSRWLRHEGPAASVSGNVYTWELHDLPAIEDEPLGIDVSEFAPRLALAVLPPPGKKTPPAFATWDDVARWFNGLANGRVTATPEIEAEARRLSTPDAPWIDRVGATARFVRDHVRYVAREIGIGGYQPHAAAETMSKLHGDCKDKATLFRAMLSALGVQALPVLVNATRGGTLAEDVPSPLPFNHLIAAVPVPAGTTVPAAWSGAIVDGGAFGRLLLVDTTAETNALGTIEPSMAGHKAVVVGPEAAAIVTIPVPPADAHRIERKLAIKAQPGGMAAFTAVSTFAGEPACAQRNSWRHSERDYRTHVENYIRAAFVDARIDGITVNEESADGTFVETVSWSAQLLPATPGWFGVPVFTGGRELLPRVPLTRRKTTVRYAYPRTLRVETTLLGFRSITSPLPESRRIANDRWIVETAFTGGNTDLHATWQLQLTGPDFPTEALADLKKLYSVVGSTAGEVMPIQP